MKNKSMKLGAVALSLILLAGCGGSPSENTGKNAGKSVSVEKSKDNQKKIDGVKKSDGKNIENKSGSRKLVKVCMDYIDVMSNPKKLNFEENFPTTGYLYSVVNMNGYKEPVLLIGKESENGIMDIKAVYYENGIIISKNHVSIGVGSVGGFRGSLSASKEGNGLIQVYFSSGTGEGEVERYTLKGDMLEHEKIADVREASTPEEVRKELKNIEWSELYDIEPLLDGMNLNEKQKKEIIASRIKSENKSGKQIFEGTLRVFTKEEVLKAQKIDDPNPGTGNPDDRYVVLVLDNERKATFKNYREEKVTDKAVMLSIMVESEFLIPDTLKSLDGKKVIVAAGENDGGWPSDSSIPLGQPIVSPSMIIEKQ